MANEDVQTTVSNLDIQILNAERAETTTFKLDNPKQNLTREMVSAAMQPALANGWLLTSKGSVAMYLGDVTYNTSTKIKLGGEDFYVTPTSLELTPDFGPGRLKGTVNVSGATIQGYNIVHVSGGTPDNIEVVLSENKLTATIKLTMDNTSTPVPNCDYNLELVIQGIVVTVPVIAHIN